MTGFILKRLASAVPSLFGVMVLTFVVSRAMPGDPAAFFAGPAATPESIARVRAQLGFDQPIVWQFLDYITDLLHGDLGLSFASGQPVLDDLMRRLPASMELTLLALVIALAVALPMGILAAVKPGTWIDHICRGSTTLAAALPSFFIGLLLIYVFYFRLGWAPSPIGRLEIWYSSPAEVTGFYTIDALLEGNFETFRAAAAQLVLPALSLSLFALAPLARMTRASMLGVLNAEFITTATALGLSRRTILINYALRNAMMPMINIIGMVFSFLLGANVLIEQVYGWPGIGSYAVEAVLISDYAAIQGFVVIMAVIYILLNLIIDITNTIIDPRVSHDA
ncbi:ABC transporter permease [Falsigemmobacter faecalis]|uniref:ABC transporter permease n=1 Tax=Falsigemmobacter faecalis TaxID=2488730 RepID=A0A3P3DDM3_9RHOB|nr:ABC transporter permease [Falsigemmobacter faecalis]RRH72391.1 ABC transporter permease [Falsigemmobacter faecalis]